MWQEIIKIVTTNQLFLILNISSWINLYIFSTILNDINNVNVCFNSFFFFKLVRNETKGSVITMF